MSLYLCLCKWYRQVWSAESGGALWPWQICVIMSKLKPQGQPVLHSSQYMLPIRAFIKHSLAQWVTRKSDGISLKLCFHRRRHTWRTETAVFSPHRPLRSACRLVAERPGTTSDQNRLWVYVTNRRADGEKKAKEQPCFHLWHNWELFCTDSRHSFSFYQHTWWYSACSNRQYNTNTRKLHF